MHHIPWILVNYPPTNVARISHRNGKKSAKMTPARVSWRILKGLQFRNTHEKEIKYCGMSEDGVSSHTTKMRFEWCKCWETIWIWHPIFRQTKPKYLSVLGQEQLTYPCQLLLDTLHPFKAKQRRTFQPVHYPTSMFLLGSKHPIKVAKETFTLSRSFKNLVIKLYNTTIASSSYSHNGHVTQHQVTRYISVSSLFSNIE